MKLPKREVLQTEDYGKGEFFVKLRCGHARRVQVFPSRALPKAVGCHACAAKKPVKEGSPR